MPEIQEKSLEQLLELIGGDKPTLNSLIETFLEEGAEIVSDMKSALQDENIDVLRRGAHSLKSSAQDFGAISLSELSATLESQCKNGWPDRAADQTEAISVSFSEAASDLREYIDKNNQ